MLKPIMFNFNSLIKVHIFNNQFPFINKDYLIGQVNQSKQANIG